MHTLVERLLAAYLMLSREIRRARRRTHPNAERIARLRAERQAVKSKLARHWPTPNSALAFVRQSLRRILQRGR
ncbi:hypothetical protein [Sphingomonas lenta]|uniref:Transposase n=1 Tax=Sphingomonas lenta TaxID=1141887 RepID=A0A2A2SIL7_9SPHN|nr:hypothetical protein [Sphingomonas lenta]PAX08861.1 hypothetical protein CKY28_05770 [Sphingomonas lenta]